MSWRHVNHRGSAVNPGKYTRLCRPDWRQDSKGSFLTRSSRRTRRRRRHFSFLGHASPAACLEFRPDPVRSAATKVNAKGQVEDTCVCTGMAFDPMYYYHHPRSPFAQHGYGPVLMAGAEMIKLLKNDRFTIATGIIQYLPKIPKP